MDAWKNWPRLFGIDSEHAGAFAREGHGEAMSPGNLAKFFTWCIQKGLIDQQEAAQFVAELSAKPIVNAAFFEQPIDPQVWELVKGIHAWSPTLVPLAYWEDHLLLGTPLPPWETPPLRKLRTPALIVVAPALDLQDYFERLTGQTGTWSNLTDHTVGPLGSDESNSQISVELPPGEETLAAYHAITSEIEVEPPAAPSTAELQPLPPQTESVIEMPQPVAPLAPPITAAQAVAPKPAAAPSAAKKATPASVDDPFAALAAAAGVEIESGVTDEVKTEADDEAPTEEMPDGLDLCAQHVAQPEGLNLTSQETATTNSHVAFDWTPETETAAPPSAESSAAMRDEATSEVVTDSGFEPIAVEFDLPPPPPPTAPPPVMAKSKPQPATPPQAQAEQSEALAATSTEESSGPKELHQTVMHDFADGSEEIIEKSQAEAHLGLSNIEIGSAEEEARLSLSNITMSDLPAAAEEDEPPTTQISRHIANVKEAGSRVMDIEGMISPARGNRQGSTSTKVININSLEPMMLDDCHTFDQIGAQVLVQVQGVFESGMILLFQGGQLMPWKWSDLMLSVKGENPDAIQLEDPSVFRIVYRTALPYHGYVVTNPINQKFFNEFTRGMLPKHMTIIPVMIEKQMCGMLLAISNQDVQLRQSLRTMERLAFELSRGCKRLRGGASKAA